jgi:thymidylate synthase
MSNYSYSLESDSLSDLLQKAKNLLLKNGIETKSQRGLTYSLNNVFLTWVGPVKDKTRYSFWDKKSDEWYQDNFVRKNKGNLPEIDKKSGSLLIPYRYAERSRYHDSGWGYGLAVVRAAKKVGKIKDINKWLVEMGELVHLQTIMAVLLWWGKDNFEFWLKNEAVLERLVKSTRVDTLDKIVLDIKNNPQSRRAILPSFMYGLDYFLNPLMGVSCYQNFQLLPSGKNEPLSSLHWHRSLDCSGGAQLDFNHDHDWLAYASKKAGRSMGNINLVVGNLHLYMTKAENTSDAILPNDSVEKRLCMWTDGYRSGNNTAAELMTKENYKKNAKRLALQFK